MRSIGVRWLTLMLVALGCSSVRADVKLSVIFGDNMVLQADKPLPVWGTADPGEEVTVTIGDDKATAKADPEGKWQVRLPARKATATPVPMKVAGKNSIEIANVVVGEVWLCSGQSNMEWPVSRASNNTQETAEGNFPLIRHIKIRNTPADKPQANAPSPAGWQAASPQTVGNFTAVGYFFARRIQQDLNVPVGLIGSNWGGTRIEPWTPPEGFKQVMALKDTADNLDKFPQKNPDGSVNNRSPLSLYNGMIHPLVPFAIRGALWYQGEANNGEGMLYTEKMKALIQGWRTVWNQGDFPFYFVQLAPYRYTNQRMPDPATQYQLPGIWEAQTAALAIPNTGMAVTTDIVEKVTDIHPINKQDVGKRLALWALANTYGKKDLVYSSPLYDSMVVEGNKIRLKFKHVGGGLVSRDQKDLSWFSIAGEDKVFKKAEAKIEGDAVVVSSPEVSAPVAVRFGWNEIAEPNLSSKAGLPASPFRTDKWTDATNAAP